MVQEYHHFSRRWVGWCITKRKVTLNIFGNTDVFELFTFIESFIFGNVGGFDLFIEFGLEFWNLCSSWERFWDRSAFWRANSSFSESGCGAVWVSASDSGLGLVLFWRESWNKKLNINQLNEKYEISMPHSWLEMKTSRQCHLAMPLSQQKGVIPHNKQSDILVDAPLSSPWIFT